MSDWSGKHVNRDQDLGTTRKEATGSAPSAPPSRQPTHRRALVVLGMHRSGTSAITRVCNLMGADLPRNLLPADSHNERGYWEPEAVKVLNDELLASIGSSWDDPQRSPKSWHGTLKEEEFRHRAVRTLADEFGNSPLFVLKDPRICRLVAPWVSALMAFGAEPAFVISVRNPLEVAASLKKRDGFPQSRSLLLWLRHVLEAEFGSRGSRRSAVFYADLLQDPPKLVRVLAADLQIEWPQPLWKAGEAIKEFLRQGLRHHEFGDSDLHQSPEVSAWVEEAYHLFRTRLDSDDTKGRFDRLRERLDCASNGAVVRQAAVSIATGGLEHANECESMPAGIDGKDLGSAPARIQQSQDTLLQSLSIRVTELEATTGQLQRMLLEQADSGRFERQLSDQENQIRQLESALSESAARLEEESARANTLQTEIARWDGVMREMQQNLASTAAALEDRNQEARYLLGQVELLGSAVPFQRRVRKSLPQRILGALLHFAHAKPSGFDAEYYVARHVDVAEAGYDPLVHYLLFGRKEGRRYKSDDPAFSLYREMSLIQRSGLYDQRYYSSRNPDVIAAGIDPVEHFLRTGAWESRMPSAGFDPAFYLNTYPDVAKLGMNPLVHYLQSGIHGNRSPLPPALTKTEAQPPPPPAVLSSPEEEIDIPIGQPDIRLIAFYLPQFHPIAENDRFWGKGFTEWTNVTRAKPLFPGHHQPRLPGELGFYDLRLPEIQKRQIEMAKTHGIHAFCYHYYWFNGRSVMNRPLNQMLDDPSLDLPFCLHWANEPWTSSWDGCNQEGILLHQAHTPEDDLAFMRGIQRALLDERYVRVNGRPLLAVYRPGLFPNIRATVDRWRSFSLKEGIGELYLVVTQQPFDGTVDPREYGFDAAVEFPPHNLPVADVREEVGLTDPEFKGFIASYSAVKEASLAKSRPDYTLFRGIMPGFDNTARRENAAVYIGNSPGLYQEWLEGLCRYTRQNLPGDERLIFVNAWNEWAEGAYLEPDNLHGFAYLNRTARALRKFTNGNSSRKVIFVGHDAVRAGAQILLLDMLRWVRESTATETRLILGSGGDLLESYKEITEVLILDDLHNQPASERGERIREFTGKSADLIFANTVVSGEYLPELKFLGAPIVTHIHELEKSIRKFASTEALKNVLEMTQRFIAASGPVAANLINRHGVKAGQIETICEFIRPVAQMDGNPAERQRLRLSLGLEERDVAVFSCGTRDWRKGPDIFVDVAAGLLNRGISNFKCFWVGAPITGEYADLESNLAARGLSAHVKFLGEKTSARDYFAGADIFLLPSREDPYPLVCLEAADYGLPIICFADAGGMPDFVEDDAGIVVPFEDVEAMTDAVARLIIDRGERTQLGSKAHRKLRERHTTETTMPEIFHVMREVAGTPPVVSVIIPSYNYEQYLEKRFDSIFKQTFQDIEIVVEDDCSTDGTFDLLTRYESRRNVRVVRHDENRGVFAMWSEGLKAASGRIIWIAEEDDLCKPEFLEKLLPAFDDDRVKLVYCQSDVIDEAGLVVGDYTHCFPEFSNTKWTAPYVQPIERELHDGLAAKNFILNASGVLFRKPDPSEAERVLKGFAVAGDWRLYLHILEDGQIAYIPEKLNFHRRHPKSVIGRQGDLRLLVSEAGKIHRYVAENYSYTQELAKKLSMHWLAVWRERNPHASEQDFWRAYEGDHVKGTSEQPTTTQRT